MATFWFAKIDCGLLQIQCPLKNQITYGKGAPLISEK